MRHYRFIFPILLALFVSTMTVAAMDVLAAPPSKTVPGELDLSGIVVKDGWVLTKKDVRICEAALSSCIPILDRLERTKAKAPLMPDKAKNRIAQLERIMKRTTTVLRQMNFNEQEIDAIVRGKEVKITDRHRPKGRKVGGSAPPARGKGKSWWRRLKERVASWF